MTKIGFIGAGNMGYAIMKGILGSKDIEAELYAYDTYAPALERAAEIGVNACGSAAETVEKCKYVFSCRKAAAARRSSREHRGSCYRRYRNSIHLCGHNRRLHRIKDHCGG